MTPIPPIPDVDDAPPELFERGHLWIQEQVDGDRLVFHVRNDGVLEFEIDDRRVPPAEIPWPFRRSVRHVRERFDRDRLRAAIDEVTRYRFVGIATIKRSIDYDWDRLPPFIGVDIWDRSAERLLVPDVVEKIYDELGLDPIVAVRKEVRAVDFDPNQYAVPESLWYDGPAFGVLVRNKTGDRALRTNPSIAKSSAGISDRSDPDSVAAALVTGERIRRAISSDTDVTAVAIDDVLERVLETVAMETGHRIFTDGDPDRLRAFRGAATRRIEAYLTDRY